MKLRYLFLIIIFIFAVPVLPAQDLINAVKSGKIERVKKLLPYENMEEKDENNYTAYHWTAILGLKDIAILLLENGAEPNALVTDVPSKKISGGNIIWAGDISGAPSAPIIAQESGNNKLIDFYLSQGKIDLHLRSAVMCDNAVVTEKALKAGANPNMMINMAGDRILTAAIESSLGSGSDTIVDILKKYGADISAAFATSFVYGYVSENSATWEKMIKKGAKVNQQYHDGNYNDTLLSIAFKEDKDKLNFLVKHGADLTIQDKDGRTLLHRAVAKQTNVHLLIPPEDICNKACLAKYLSIRDNNGETACDIAKRMLS
ncbi:MAG: ankyrin repeat domain-containing protein, partial [Elusimicrobiaceae bacterium]|nr:ankyrin repeat domain-containing protein [Elusimicrobiaceae bacterium]